MKSNHVLELRVGVDVGCHNHNVAIGLSTGEILEEFSIVHTPEGFRKFFLRIESLLSHKISQSNFCGETTC